MAHHVSALPRREEQMALPLGPLAGGIVAQAGARMQARKAEEARLWAGLNTHGMDWLIANTTPWTDEDEAAL